MRLFLPFIIAIALTAAAAVSYVRGEESAARAGDLHVTSGWARATPPGASVGSAYVTLRNAGAGADRLVRAESPAAGSVHLHRTEGSGDVARMRPAGDGIPVAAGETLAMAPGGIHIMLMNLKTPLTAGEAVPLTLVFEAAGSLTLTVPVEPVGSPGPAGSHDPHAHSAH